MEKLQNKLREFWSQRNLIPAGAWVMLLSYSLVAFGSPMPPRITWLEIVMGAGLLIGGSMLAGKVIRQAREDAVTKWVLILAFVLLLVPTCTGLVHGNTWGDMVRDMVPLIFLLAPAILLGYSSAEQGRSISSRLLATMLVVVGIVTAATFFIGIYQVVGSTEAMTAMIRGGFAQFEASQGAVQAASVAQIEFNNKIRVIFIKLYDPAMLFAAIFLSAWGAVLIIKSWATSLPGALLLALGASIAYGFMMLGLRAYSAFFVLAIGVVGATRWREAGFYFRFIPLIALSSILLWPQIDTILQLLWAKQQTMGTNGKFGEWQAVILTVFQSFQTSLTGVGWGGLLQNPILGEQTRFTHSGLSYFLLKSGLVGIFSLLCCIWLLVSGRIQISLRKLATFELITLVSCLPPIIIGVLFQPTYKMLSYGFVLALLLLLGPPRAGAKDGADC